MELPANIGIMIKPTNAGGRSMIIYKAASASEDANNGIAYFIALTVFPILMKGMMMKNEDSGRIMYFSTRISPAQIPNINSKPNINRNKTTRGTMPNVIA